MKRFGEPTWQWLVDAVGDQAGGAHMALARDIARRYSMSGCLCTISSAKSVCHGVAWCLLNGVEVNGRTGTGLGSV